MLASAIREMLGNETITESPKDCDDSGTIWESGKQLTAHASVCLDVSMSNFGSCCAQASEYSTI